MLGLLHRPALMLALIPALVLAAGPAASATGLAAPRIVTRSALAADVDLLQRAYEQLHPGLYRYNTPAQVAAHFDTLRTDLDHDQTLPQAYLAFSKFAATLRCGHTYANFYNQTDAVRHALFEGQNRVPFYFRWLGKRMVVTRDFSAHHQLPPGTEVLSIQDVPVSVILDKLMSVARADGSNDAKRIALMEVQGTDRYESFDVFLPLLYPQIGTRLRLRTRTPGGSLRRLSVRALSYAERLAQRPTALADEHLGWRFDDSDPGFARLSMPNWALYDTKWDWKGFLQRSFEDLAAHPRPALVIDLRGNEGGLDVGEEILPHLLSSAFAVPDPQRRVRYRKVPDDLAPYLDTWDASFKDWGDAAQPYDERFYILTRYQDGSGSTQMAPRLPKFGGRVFVLVDADNSSATFQFAQQIQQARLGTLVGQPTGGNQRGINGGAFFFLRLPNSKLELDLPLIATFPAGDPPDAGLTPDVLVVPTVDDIVAGRDAALAAIRRLLEQPEKAGN